MDKKQEKPIDWRGTSLEDLKGFPAEMRREAGNQLHRIQNGLDPEHWKPFSDVGSGAREIILANEDGWYRVLYVAKFSDVVYVLHSFQKKTNATSKQDKDIAIQRYKEIICERIGK